MTKKKIRKVKKKNNLPNIILIVGITIISIPFLILGWIVISASLDTGTPILGERYSNDLDPAITKDNLTAIKTKLKDISGVESVEVELATATLRVYLDVEDNMSKDDISTKTNEAYEVVLSILDPVTYFSQTNGKKMYDLEVHVYNLNKDRDDDGFIYVIATKTSSMEKPNFQVVSDPIDAELAQQLRDDVEAKNNPKPEENENEDSNEDVVNQESE